MSSPSKLRSRRKDWIVRLMHKRIPVTKWLPEYDKDKALADFIAGVTVGLTVIPQALAYAVLGGLEPQFGLYSSFMGCFVYIIFGSCKDITLGPTALLALMTYTQIQGRSVDYAILLTFLTGVVQLILGLLHLGVLIDFISIPVTVGFTSATSVIIAVSQLKGLLGLKFSSGSFINTVKQIATNLPNAKIADSTMGFVCIAILLLMRKLKDIKLPPGQQGLKKALWLLSTSRNALVVVFCSVIAYTWTCFTESPFQLTGTVMDGLPSWKLPPFHTYDENGVYVSFWQMCSNLGSSILVLPFIAVLGNVAIAKAFASGDSVDATQELITLSLANILGSFVSAMPITGSFSRSAVNHASGVATQFGSIYTGIIVLLALSLLTPYFYYIPKASLAAVVICAVIFMIEYEVVKPMWRSRRADLIPAVVTFVLCLLVGVELGICAGVAVNVMMLLYHSARPQLYAEIVTVNSGFSYVRITVGSLYFPGMEYIRQYVERAAKKQGDCTMPVVIDCRYVLGADFTAAKGICALSNSLAARGQPLVLLSPQDSVSAVISNAGPGVILVTPNQLEQTLQELSKQIAMGTFSNGKNITPPPSYNSLQQFEEIEEATEVVIASRENSMPLLTNRSKEENGT